MPEEDPPAGVPEWVLTYGDMMSLLLCFFVLLAAMSELKKEKPQFIIESLLKQFATNRTFSQFMKSQNLSASSLESGRMSKEVRKKDPSERRQGEQGAKHGPEGEDSTTTVISDGKRLTIGPPILFEPGETTLTDQGKVTLRQIAEKVRGIAHLIEVTATIPEKAGGGVNADSSAMTNLAFQRIETVVDYLVNEEKLNRDYIRMAIAAPLATNTGKENDPLNNRVDVQQLDASQRDF